MNEFLIQDLLKISATKNFSQNFSPRPLNTALPVVLEVLEFERDALYKIKIGNLTTHAKSATPLFPGQKYFANISQSTQGIVVNALKNLPKIMEILQNPSLQTMDTATLRRIFSAPDPKNEAHNALLHHMANAENRGDFLAFYHQISALKNDIFSFFVRENDKNHLLQISAKNANSIAFYGLFPHLGSISGNIFLARGETFAKIFSEFYSVRDFLRANLKNFSKNATLDPKNIEISVRENIAPMHAPADGLLDLRG